MCSLDTRDASSPDRRQHRVVIEGGIRNSRKAQPVRNQQPQHMPASRIRIAAAARISESERTAGVEIHAFSWKIFETDRADSRAPGGVWTQCEKKSDAILDRSHELSRAIGLRIFRPFEIASIGQALSP